jgi:hypothetical protein
MKNIIKIAFTMLLVAVSVVAVNAQFRRYPYPYRNPYQRLQQNMEHNQNQDQANVYRNRDSKLWLTLDYAVSQPLGSLKDYADKTSFAGWNVSLLYQFNPKIAAGLGVGFYNYYQKIPRQVYEDKTTSISAVQSHTLQLIPIQPTIVFTPHGGEAGVQPYVGLGVGVADVNYEKYWGEFVDKTNKVGFSVSPMAGVRIPIGKTSPVKVNIGVKYNYAPFAYNEIKNISTVEANAGISIHLR